MNYLFIIQGEGKGHMSQALALYDRLTAKGDSVNRVCIGASPQRELPVYIMDHFGDRIRRFRSPNFIMARDRKGIRPVLTLFYNLLISPVFVRSIVILRKEIRSPEIDIVVNFYDMIGGLAAFISRSGKKTVVLSHHFFLTGKYFRLPSKPVLQRVFLKSLNRFSSLGASEIWALSFSRYENYGRVWIKPPVLRKQVYKLKPSIGKHILVYLLNPGLIDEIIPVSLQFPQYSFRIYSSANISSEDIPGNIEILEPSESGFLADLASSRALITSAGFESQCEGAFLGKPVFTIPSKKHFEQMCNAVDGKRSGISFGFDEFDPELSPDRDSIKKFRDWCSESEW